MALWLLFAIVCGSATFADKNEEFHVSTFCDREKFQQLYKKIDGAVLRSDNEDNLDCDITFQTDTVLQRFMLRFDELQLDCNDHLFIYEGAHAYGNYQADLSCRNNEHDVGIIYLHTNLVTLKYVTDGWGQIGNGFKLVLTAVKQMPIGCRDFRCSNNLCIDGDLICDNVNHCGDNSDESSFAFCRDNDSVGKVLGLEVSVFIAVIVSIFIMSFVCMASVAICIFRRQRQRQTLATSPPTYPFIPKGVEENSTNEKSHVNSMNSVYVFHSAVALPDDSTLRAGLTSPKSTYCNTNAYDGGQATTLSGKLHSLSPSRTTSGQLQSSPGHHSLPHKMKTVPPLPPLQPRPPKKHSSRREKGEWLV